MNECVSCASDSDCINDDGGVSDGGALVCDLSGVMGGLCVQCVPSAGIAELETDCCSGIFEADSDGGLTTTCE